MKEDLLSSIREKTLAQLRESGFSELTIGNYQATWNRLSRYMKRHGLDNYSSAVGERFLSDEFGIIGLKELPPNANARRRHVYVLSDMLECGAMKYRYLKKSSMVSFCGELGEPFNEFIFEQTKVKKKTTLGNYGYPLFAFYVFLRDNGLSLKTFRIQDAIRFLAKLNDEKGAVYVNDVKMSLRVFLRYLCDRKLLGDNRAEIWMAVFRGRDLCGIRVPSVYTAEEVEKLLDSIDRSTAIGKRDYAMIMLAAKCGLRSSDIRGLRFVNLIWEQNRISIIQAKTGVPLDLPMSEGVGTAIIDYIKNGRPDVNSQFVFLRANAPYVAMTASALVGVVKARLLNTGININGRSCGPHALRHSLATNLLGLNTPLPVISGVLGHSLTKTTLNYTRVDVSMLRKCSLEVPLAPSSFYDNLYGNL